MGVPDMKAKAKARKPRPDTRVRKRKFVMIELTDAERARLDRLKAAGGERATYSSTIRDLIDAAAAAL